MACTKRRMIIIVASALTLFAVVFVFIVERSASRSSSVPQEIHEQNYVAMVFSENNPINHHEPLHEILTRESQAGLWRLEKSGSINGYLMLENGLSKEREFLVMAFRDFKKTHFLIDGTQVFSHRVMVDLNERRFFEVEIPNFPEGIHYLSLVAFPSGNDEEFQMFSTSGIPNAIGVIETVVVGASNSKLDITLRDPLQRAELTGDYPLYSVAIKPNCSAEVTLAPSEDFNEVVKINTTLDYCIQVINRNPFRITGILTTLLNENQVPLMNFQFSMGIRLDPGEHVLIPAQLTIPPDPGTYKLIAILSELPEGDTNLRGNTVRFSSFYPVHVVRD